MTFTLESGAGAVPPGATITPAGGFSWTPTALQGGIWTFDVVVTDVHPRRTDETVAEFTEEFGSDRVMGSLMDAGDRDQIDATLAAARARFGTVDVLVNNAAVNALNPVGDMTPEEWDWAIGVNLSGPWYLCRALLPAMGYGNEQLADLEATLHAVPCDVVVTGTPIDLGHIIDPGHPVRHARYEYADAGTPTLAEAVRPLIERLTGNN